MHPQRTTVDKHTTMPATTFSRRTTTVSDYIQEAVDNCEQVFKLRIPDNAKPGMKIIAKLPNSEMIYIHELTEQDFGKENGGCVYLNKSYF